MTRSYCKHCFSLARTAVLALLAVVLIHAGAATAQQPPNRLAMLGEPEVMKQLNLSEPEQASLEAFLARRGEDLGKQIVALKNAPQQVRDQKLEAFHAQSEASALAMLNDDQRQTLQRLFISRSGFNALAMPPVQNQLRLTDEQRGEVTRLIAERDGKLKGVDADEATAVKLRYEVMIGNLLEPEQLQGWRVLTGEIDAKSAAKDLLADAEKAKQAAEKAKPTAEKMPNEPKEQMRFAEAGVDAAKPPAIQQDVPLKFSFAKEDWSVVIEWFAEQAQLNLKMQSVPEGTLSYVSDREYTVLQAMDFLNNQLLEKDYTLVRYDDLLTVINLADGIPPSVIETVTPDELPNRGKYEIVKCVFDFSDVDGTEFSGEIAPLVNTEKGQGQITYLPSSNRMIVQETGGKLRTIHSILEIAETRASKARGSIETIKLEHVTIDELMVVARPLFGIDDGEFSIEQEERRLSLVPDLYGNRLFVDGSSEMVSRFRSLVDQVDIEGEEVDTTAIEENTFKTYRTKLDPVIVEQVLRRMFGTEEGMRLARDENTGFIVVEGRPSQHAMVDKALQAMEGEASTTTSIELTRWEPADMIVSVNSLMKVTKDEAGNPTGTLILEEDPEKNRIIVRGTEREVAEVQEIVNTIDPPIGSKEFERSNLRIIPLSPSASARALESASQIWPYMERKNPITYIVPGKGEFNPANPQELKKMLGTQDIFMPGDRTQELEQGSAPDLESDSTGSQDTGSPRLVPDADSQENAPKVPVELSPKQTRNSQPRRSSRPRSSQLVAYTMLLAPQTAQSGSDAQPEAQKKTGQIEPATTADEVPAIVSVPGAEIIVQVSRGEVLLYSRDLDALDELEQLLTESESTAGSEDPKVFLLQHRTASQAKAVLEEILGISSGDSGADGGLGGLMGNMAQNMIPGGDMLGGLLGGGGSASLTSIRTVAEVSITADANLNALIVYAVDEDVETIKRLLTVIDQEAPHDPLLDGKTYRIPVVHADAEDLVEVVKEQLAARIRSAEQQSGGGEQNNPQAEILKALMQGRRGGGGGGGGGGDSSEPPKISITAYEPANWILVTGPEFLFRQVNEIVMLLDTEEALERAPITTVLPAQGINAEMLEEALKSIYGDKVTVEAPTGGGGAGGSSRNNGSSPAGNSQPNDANAARRQADFIRRIQESQRGGGQRGNFGQRGGGGQRGGDQRGDQRGGNRGGQ